MQKPLSSSSEVAGRPYAVSRMRQDLRLIARWRLRLRDFLDSEALIIAGCWGFWLFMVGVLVWLVGYCWYWGLIP